MTTDAPADIILIERRDGTTVRRIADADRVNGDATYTWTGRNAAGERVRDARYRVVATTQGPDGEVRQRAPVVLDTRAPSFAWRSIAPEPVRTTGRVRFTFVVRDRFSDRVRTRSG